MKLSPIFITKPTYNFYSNKVQSKNEGYTHKNNFVNIFPQYYTNISFGSCPANILMENSERAFCAYSGCELLSKSNFSKICEKLKKKHTLEETVYFLAQYRKTHMVEPNNGAIVPTIEGCIFDIFNEKYTRKYYGKMTFKDVLILMRLDALDRVKKKYINVLKSGDNIIKKFSPDISDLVKLIKQDCLTKACDGNFNRDSAINKILSIKVEGKDVDLMNRLLKKWWELPCTNNNIDAFIVHYSKKSHQKIAKRLLSPAIGTWEHINPQSISHDNSLGNSLLVCERYNNERGTMPLNLYMNLRSDLNIQNNLQDYIDFFYHDVENKTSPFISIHDYPKSIAKTLYLYTGERLNLFVGKTPISDKIKIQKKNHNGIEEKIKQLQKKYTP